MLGIVLTDEEVRKAQELWRKEFGEELTMEEARREAENLLELALIALDLDYR